jgi:carbon-monoxide dehydrogenase small subunit
MADEEKVPQQSGEDAPMKISRRDFLVGAGAGVVATGAVAGGYIALRPAETVEVVKQVETVKEVTKEAESAQTQAEPVKAVAEVAEPISGKRLIVLNVNGQDYQVAVEPQMTLAEVLRRELGLTGTHLGCNGSYCSSCTVLVDGVAENSCSLLAIREASKKITTIEGLEQEGELHPVQQAFWEQMGYQCGFCTSGQIMRAVELLNKVKNPSEAQIRRHMSGNLCKCSAYPNIVKAVQQAAEMMA